MVGHGQPKSRGHSQPRSAMFGHGQGWPDLGQSWLAMTSQRQAAASLLWQCLATARGRQTLADHGWPLPAKWQTMASPGRQCLATARGGQTLVGMTKVQRGIRTLFPFRRFEPKNTIDSSTAQGGEDQAEESAHKQCCNNIHKHFANDLVMPKIPALDVV